MLLSGLRFAGRLFVFMLTAWFIMATPLLAEDIAFRRIIGFSPDGNYFAFEQSGFMNGSGDSYAEIFLIDTHRNTWVEGSPFRARGGGGPAGLRQVRWQVVRQARPALRQYGVRAPGVVLASNPVTEISALPNRVTVAGRRSLHGEDRPLVFSIEEIEVPTPRCRTFTSEPIKGMVIRVRRDTGQDEVLHEDERIPASRGCPTGYRIEDIVRLSKEGGGAVYVILYSFVSAGEHGEELRYIAGGWHDDSGDYRESEPERDLYDYSGRPDYAEESSDEDMDNFERRDYYRHRWERYQGWEDRR
jgi:predicted secreted protein